MQVRTTFTVTLPQVNLAGYLQWMSRAHKDNVQIAEQESALRRLIYMCIVQASSHDVHFADMYCCDLRVLSNAFSSISAV